MYDFATSCATSSTWRASSSAKVSGTGRRMKRKAGMSTLYCSYVLPPISVVVAVLVVVVAVVLGSGSDCDCDCDSSWAEANMILPVPPPPLEGEEVARRTNKQHKM